MLSNHYHRDKAKTRKPAAGFASKGRQVPDALRSLMRDAEKLHSRAARQVLMQDRDAARSFIDDLMRAVSTLRARAYRCTGTTARRVVADQAKALARKLSALASEIRKMPDAPAPVPLPLLDLEASLPDAPASAPMPAEPAPLALPDAVPAPVDLPPRSDYYWTKLAHAQDGTLPEFLASKRDSQAEYASKGTGAISRKRYAQSEKGKATRKRYTQSEKGREAARQAARRYAQSEKGREAARRYAQSEKGKAARARAQAAFRARKKV
jgi:hypothetical protein